MIYCTTLITKLALLDCVYLSFEQNVCAYLDPGTGSYIFQILVALLVGSWFAIKIYWRKIKVSITYLFSNLKRMTGYDKPNK